MNTKDCKTIIYYLIIFILFMSILCYFVNQESFVDTPSKKKALIASKKKALIASKKGSKKITPKRGPKRGPKKGAKKSKKVKKKSGTRDLSVDGKIYESCGKPQITTKLEDIKCNDYETIQSDLIKDVSGNYTFTCCQTAAQVLAAATASGDKKKIEDARKALAIAEEKARLTKSYSIKNTLDLKNDLTRPTYNKTDTNMPERTVKVPKTKLRLSDDKTSYNNTGKNIEDTTQILRCWKNELIANIKDNTDHYEFKCYDVSYNNKRGPSAWHCQVNNNWTIKGENNSISAYRKNADGFVECGSTSNRGDCKKYTDIGVCRADTTTLTSLSPGKYTCNDTFNLNYGVNKYHWCTLNYETLTDLDTKGAI